MAGVGTESSLFYKLEEEHLTCQICLERFKDARVLPCQHYYCTECLTQLSKGENTLKCPACRFESRLSGGGVLGLPRCISVNAFVAFLEERNTTYEDGRLVCDGCEDKMAAMRCIDCAANLCDICGKSHAKMKVTKAHKQMTLADYLSVKSKVREQDKLVPQCTQHTDWQKIYCSDCQVTVCLECSVFDHAQHSHVRLAVAVQDANLKSKIESCLTDLKKKEQQTVDSRNNIQCAMEMLLNNEKEKIENASKLLLQKVTEITEAIKRQINSDKTNKMEYLQTQYAQIIQNMSSQFERLEKDINHLSPLKSSLQEAMLKSASTITAKQVTAISEAETSLRRLNTDIVMNIKFPVFKIDKSVERALQRVEVKHTTIGHFASRHWTLSNGSPPVADNYSRCESCNHGENNVCSHTGENDDTTDEDDDSSDSSCRCQLVDVDIKIQKEAIRELMETRLKEGDTWYLVAKRWFNQWEKYVGYYNWNSKERGEQRSNPGPIDNSRLLKENGRDLKDNLDKEYSYIPVPEEAWKKLSSWYGKVSGQRPMARKVRINRYSIFVEDCHEESLQKIELRNYSRIRNMFVIGKFTDRHTIGDIEGEMRKLFNVSENKETRVLKKCDEKSMKNTYELLNDKTQTVDQAELYYGDKTLILEERNYDGSWPNMSYH